MAPSDERGAIEPADQLVGSGGGKSSIVCLLERFYTPEQGAVLLDDVAIGDLSPDYLHQRVALVGQVSEASMHGGGVARRRCGLLVAIW